MCLITQIEMQLVIAFLLFMPTLLDTGVTPWLDDLDNLHLLPFQLPSCTVSRMHLCRPVYLYFVDCIWHEISSLKARFNRANGLLILSTTASCLQQSADLT